MRHEFRDVLLSEDFCATRRLSVYIRWSTWLRRGHIISNQNFENGFMIQAPVQIIVELLTRAKNRLRRRLKANQKCLLFWSKFLTTRRLPNVNTHLEIKTPRWKKWSMSEKSIIMEYADFRHGQGEITRNNPPTFWEEISRGERFHDLDKRWN